MAQETITMLDTHGEEVEIAPAGFYHVGNSTTAAGPKPAADEYRRLFGIRGTLKVIQCQVGDDTFYAVYRKYAEGEPQ